MNAVTPGEFALADSLDLGLLGAIEVRLSVEVGGVRMTVDALSRLTPGTVIELDRASDERVDVLVNDRLFARGEVVTVGTRFGIRITDLAARPA